MKKILAVLCLSALSLSLVNCSSDAQSAPASTPPNSQSPGGQASNGAGPGAATWQHECIRHSGLRLIGVSYTTTYNFSGNLVARADQYFSDSRCTVLATAVTYSGTFEVKDQIAAGVYQINFSYNTVTVIPQNDRGVDFLNDFHVCGKGDWALNVSADVTAQRRDLSCNLSKAPEVVYDIETVRDGFFYLGRSNDNVSPDYRPSELEMLQPFHKI